MFQFNKQYIPIWWSFLTSRNLDWFCIVVMLKEIRLDHCDSQYYWKLSTELRHVQQTLASYAGVFSVVTQRSSPQMPAQPKPTFLYHCFTGQPIQPITIGALSANVQWKCWLWDFLWSSRCGRWIGAWNASIFLWYGMFWWLRHRKIIDCKYKCILFDYQLV